MSPMSAPLGTSSPARLLVVDDLEVNRELLARRVRRLGHEAGFAEDGHAALAQLSASSWDLVLLDITMPGLDGYDTLGQIRANPAWANLPVIMVTAIDDTDSVVRCLELGADDYVTKPFNPTVLQARIESSLARKRLADQRQAMLRALSRELEIGQQIQRGFLPEQLPTCAGWELAALCTPARQVGGDFYDALVLPGGRLGLAVADVCDKGVGAALYMALFRTLLRAQLLHLRTEESVAAALPRVLRFINDYIAGEHGRDNMFATMFVGVLDPASGQFDYVNAGHDAPFVRRASTAEIEPLPPLGPAVGLLPGVHHAAASTQLHPGDVLLAFTDGATDAQGTNGALGDGPLLESLRGPWRGATALVDALAARIGEHVGDRPAHDDLTLLCLGRQAP